MPGRRKQAPARLYSGSRVVGDNGRKEQADNLVTDKLVHQRTAINQNVTAGLEESVHQ